MVLCSSIGKKIRLYPGDDYPGNDTAQHKSHIPKITVLAAYSEPHSFPDETTFEGKVGIWRLWRREII